VYVVFVTGCGGRVCVVVGVLLCDGFSGKVLVSCNMEWMGQMLRCKFVHPPPHK